MNFYNLILAQLEAFLKWRGPYYYPEPERSEGEGSPEVWLGYSHVKKHLKNYAVVIK
jgi:hypothetical protein